MNKVLKASKQEIKRIQQFYKDYEVPNNSDSIVFYAKTKYITVTIYTSNKVMFQGQDALQEYEMWQAMLAYQDKPKQQTNHSFYVESIGSDEVGTGDFFGPVTVCAAYVSKDIIPLLKQWNIDDSKALKDHDILKIGAALKDKVTYSLLTLHNKKYNALYKKGFNLNTIKAYLHNQAICHVIDKIKKQPLIIMDQFVEKEKYYNYIKTQKRIIKDIEFYTKAEHQFASVALASIIARYAFLKHMDRLSEDSGYTLLKGAGHKVDILASTIIQDKGKAYLETIAKCNFKTMKKATELIDL